MPIAKKNINPDFLNQLKTNITKETDTADYAQNKAVSVQAIKQTFSEEPQAKYADVMNVRLSKGRRNEIKAFCTSCGITITQYIESSFEFLAEEVAAGRISISKGGIKKVE